MTLKTLFLVLSFILLFLNKPSASQECAGIFEFTSEKGYQQGQLAGKNGNIYESQIDYNWGNDPASRPQQWKPVGSCQGYKCSDISEWKSTVNYKGDQEVSQNGLRYKAIKDSLGQSPWDFSQSYYAVWQIVGLCYQDTNSVQEYDSKKIYYRNDLVKKNGNVYIAKYWVKNQDPQFNSVEYGPWLQIPSWFSITVESECQDLSTPKSFYAIQGSSITITAKESRQGCRLNGGTNNQKTIGFTVTNDICVYFECECQVSIIISGNNTCISDPPAGEYKYWPSEEKDLYVSLQLPQAAHPCKFYYIQINPDNYNLMPTNYVSFLKIKDSHQLFAQCICSNQIDAKPKASSPEASVTVCFRDKYQQINCTQNLPVLHYYKDITWVYYFIQPLKKLNFTCDFHNPLENGIYTFYEYESATTGADTLIEYWQGCRKCILDLPKECCTSEWIDPYKMQHGYKKGEYVTYTAYSSNSSQIKYSQLSLAFQAQSDFLQSSFIYDNPFDNSIWKPVALCSPIQCYRYPYYETKKLVRGDIFVKDGILYVAKNNQLLESQQILQNPNYYYNMGPCVDNPCKNDVLYKVEVINHGCQNAYPQNSPVYVLYEEKMQISAHEYRDNWRILGGWQDQYGKYHLIYNITITEDTTVEFFCEQAVKLETIIDNSCTFEGAYISNNQDFYFGGNSIQYFWPSEKVDVYLNIWAPIIQGFNCQYKQIFLTDDDNFSLQIQNYYVIKSIDQNYKLTADCICDQCEHILDSLCKSDPWRPFKKYNQGDVVVYKPSDIFQNHQFRLAYRAKQKLGFLTNIKPPISNFDKWEVVAICESQFDCFSIKWNQNVSYQIGNLVTYKINNEDHLYIHTSLIKSQGSIPPNDSKFQHIGICQNIYCIAK